MTLFEFSKTILANMRARKLRSFLAMFGILWGSASVILLVSIGHGFYTANKKQLDVFSSGLIFAFVGTSSKPYQGYPSGQTPQIKAHDIITLAKQLPQYKVASPVLGGQLDNVAYQQYYAAESVFGIDSHYLSLLKLKLTTPSRLFNTQDIQNRTRVAILGDTLKQKIFGDKPAVGKIIFIRKIPFQVVGVLSKDSSSLSLGVAGWVTNNLFIPYTTYQSIWGNKNVSQIILQARNPQNVSYAITLLRQTLGQEFHFDPTDKNALIIPDLKQALSFITWFFKTIELFLGFCGAMTLGVGAVGVANIMFLIVVEKTREIGLRRALGARDFDILLQILLETFLIVCFGAIAGFIIAFLGIHILQHIQLPSWLGKPEISVTSIWVTIVILIITTLLAGYFPARRAVKLDPVEALNA